jgi:parvulin-like peptidyl-prolyl isomerase
MYSSRKLLTVAAVTALALTGACNKGKKGGAESGSREDSPVVAKVNGEPVRLSALEESLRRVPFQQRVQMSQDQAKLKEYVNSFLAEEAVYVEAKKRGITDDPEVQAKIENYTKQIASNMLRRKLMNETPTDDELKSYYEANKEEFKEETVAVSRILKRAPPPGMPDTVAKRAEAEKEIRKAYQALKSGKSWDSQVKQFSDDPPPVKDKGGDRGPVPANAQSPTGQHIQNLKVGQYTEPFETPEGWEIVKVTGEKTVTTKEFDNPQVKRQIMNKLRVKKFDDFKQQLMSKADLKIEDSVLAKVDFSLPQNIMNPNAGGAPAGMPGQMQPPAPGGQPGMPPAGQPATQAEGKK